MNKTFDWTRFCKVVNKDFRNLWPMFGTTMIVLASLPFAVWLLVLVLSLKVEIAPDYRVVMIIMVSSFAAVMLPSRLYRTMNLRNEGIYYAMLPASKLEKFVSMLIFTFIVAPLVVYLGSMGLDCILRALPAGPYHEWIWQGNWGFPIPNTLKQSDAFAPGFHSFWVTASMCTSLFASPALFLYAATLFRKHKVLYTLLVLYLIEFVLSVVLIPIIVYLSQKPDFMEWLYDFFSSCDPEQVMDWFFGLYSAFNVIVTILFTWLAWHRLKKMPY